MAGRMPFALPWTLYFRVDAAKKLRSDAALAAQRQSLLERCADAFDPALHVENYEARVREYADAAIERAAASQHEATPMERAAGRPAGVVESDDGDDGVADFWDKSDLGREFLGQVLDAAVSEGQHAPSEEGRDIHVEFEPADEEPDVPLSGAGAFQR